MWACDMTKRWLFSCFLLILYANTTYAQLTATCFIAGKEQVQFAGYIVAQEKGIYKKYGLDISFILGDRTNAYDILKKNKVTFTTLLLPSALKLYTENAPIVNIGQLLNKSSLVVIAKKSTGIHKMADLRGKKIGILGGDQQIVSDALLKYYKLDVKPVVRGTSMNLFLMNGVDAVLARTYDDYHVLINSGLDSSALISFPLGYTPLNFPEDGIYCLKTTFNANPDLCKKFVSASIEGWQIAVDKPEDAIECAMRYLKKNHQQINLSHMRWVLTSLKQYVNRDKTRQITGYLPEADFRSTAEVLHWLGLLKTIPAYSSFYQGGK